MFSMLQLLYRDICDWTIILISKFCLKKKKLTDLSKHEKVKKFHSKMFPIKFLFQKNCNCFCNSANVIQRRALHWPIYLMWQPKSCTGCLLIKVVNIFSQIVFNLTWLKVDQVYKVIWQLCLDSNEDQIDFYSIFLSQVTDFLSNLKLT